MATYPINYSSESGEVLLKASAPHVLTAFEEALLAGREPGVAGPKIIRTGTSVQGKSTVDKPVSSAEYFGVSVADILEARPGVTVDAVELVLAGVDLVEGEEAFLQGTDLAALLAGGDTTDGALNRCTFVFTLSSKERFERTLWFRVVR